MAPRHKWTRVSTRHSAEMAALFQRAGLKMKTLVEWFPQYSPRSIYRHAILPISAEDPQDGRKNNRGRPPKLTTAYKRRIIRSLLTLRGTEGYFTSRRVAVEAGVDRLVSNRTVRRVMNNAGFHYLKSNMMFLFFHFSCT